MFMPYLYQGISSHIVWHLFDPMLVLGMMCGFTFVIMPLFGVRYFATVDAGIRMMDTGLCEDDEETRHNPDEVGRARTLSLNRAPPILVGPSSQPIKASISRSPCFEFTCKQIKS